MTNTRNSIYSIYGAQVKIISISGSTVKYQIIETGEIHKIGRKNWDAKVKRA